MANTQKQVLVDICGFSWQCHLCYDKKLHLSQIKVCSIKWLLQAQNHTGIIVHLYDFILKSLHMLHINQYTYPHQDNYLGQFYLKMFSMSWHKNPKLFFHFLGPKTESTVFLERLDSLPQQEIITMAFVVVVASLQQQLALLFFSFLLLMTLKERSTNRGVNGSPLEAINQPLYVETQT